MSDCIIDLKTELLAKHVKNSLKVKIGITSSTEWGGEDLLEQGCTCAYLECKIWGMTDYLGSEI